ncbi:hypothetical protein J6590_076064 [Homalodisca vitripennis]|nr:hypothetical protein J6590_076064 [Homalodisca vitripennis]
MSPGLRAIVPFQLGGQFQKKVPNQLQSLPIHPGLLRWRIVHYIIWEQSTQIVFFQIHGEREASPTLDPV